MHLLISPIPPSCRCHVPVSFCSSPAISSPLRLNPLPPPPRSLRRRRRRQIQQLQASISLSLSLSLPKQRPCLPSTAAPAGNLRLRFKGHTLSLSHRTHVRPREQRESQMRSQIPALDVVATICVIRICPKRGPYFCRSGLNLGLGAAMASDNIGSRGTTDLSLSLLLLNLTSIIPEFLI